MANLNELMIRKNLIENCGFSEFTKSDWAGYAGSTHFDDGSEPIIKHCGDIDIIFDGNGISFLTETEFINYSKESNN